LIICLAGANFTTAQIPTPVEVRPTDKPFLWRVDGPAPCYLYGTVHVPDPRVLALPDVVRRALDAADVFQGEIPLDAGTQASLMTKITLPPGQDLRKLAGEDVFARIVKLVGKALGPNVPAGAADVFATVLSTMKPWAVMSQIELLEFLADVSAGRQPLDAMLYSIAEKAGKELGALETVDEQVAVFEGFTMKEQIQMLIEALYDLEKPRPSGNSPTRELIDLYLAGDLDRLADEATKSSSTDTDLNKKMLFRVVDERNNKMAAKIAELCAKRPARSYFFAVGALHYPGETGILNQLTKKGFKVTRLGPADAGSFVRKPAA
jgi:uncharacterized protein YbaP (TraB family)